MSPRCCRRAAGRRRTTASGYERSLCSLGLGRVALSLKPCFGKPSQHLGGCSPNSTHTPYPSEYGFDATATHASPLEAGCLSSTDTDADLGKRSALIPNATWWSADVDEVAKDLAIAFIRNASRGGPFYVQLWLHMSHATIDPRPEQFEAYPYAETCLSECSSRRHGL